MAVTGLQVYELAMNLIDEVSEVGNVGTDSPEYYKTRSLNILSTLQVELLPLSEIVTPITDLSQNLSVSDRQALLVLPYGLAAHLAMTEDVNLSVFFNARYEELKRKTETSIIPITDQYDVLGGMG